MTRVYERLLLLFLLLLALGLAALTRPIAPRVGLLLSPLTAPLLALPHRLGLNLKAAWAALSERGQLLGENRRLEERLARLEGEKARLEVEVAQLERALEIRKSQAPKVVAIAPVVGEDPSGLYRRLLLGMGARQGLRPGMPVTAPQGLVGLVVEVEGERALVRTLLDPESQIGVRPAQGPGRGVARGAPPGRLLAEFPPSVQLKPGDLVVTGAVLGLFPDGIPVGEVERVEGTQGGLKLRAWIRPRVDLALLEEVYVLGAL